MARLFITQITMQAIWFCLFRWRSHVCHLYEKYDSQSILRVSKCKTALGLIW